MNWGVIGYGEIAPTFIDALLTTNGQKLVGVASVSKNQLLINQNKFPNVEIYPKYRDLLTNPNIDTVYICTTNQLHKKNVLSALKAGKNVLCEKPIGVCQSDVAEMVLEARNQNKFLMEGMWTRFLPAYQYFKHLLTLDKIGKVTFARIDFGFFSDWGPERRLKNKTLFGGTLLDNADYGIFLSQDLFIDRPTNISAAARFCETGVEDMCGVMLQYPDGSIAQLYSGFQLKTNQEALIYGEKGSIHLKHFWHGTTVAVCIGKEVESRSFPFKKNGFEYEIEEVVSCIKENQIESSIIPHKLSIEIAGIMDEIIKKIRT